MKLRILGFETTGRQASVGCIDEAGNVLEEKSDGEMNHLQSLMPMAGLLMEKNRITAADISCVAASVGPGSFTGIRIGVSSARAFAQAMGIPCISVPTLQAFLYNTGNRGAACPVLDARRGQVYAGAYLRGKNDGEIIEIVGGGAYNIYEYLELLKCGMANRGASEITFFGDGIDVYQDEILKWEESALKGRAEYRFAEGSDRFQRASSVAKLALKLFNDGRLVDYMDLNPVYMHKAEAERKLEAGLLPVKR